MNALWRKVCRLPINRVFWQPLRRFLALIKTYDLYLQYFLSPLSSFSRARITFWKCLTYRLFLYQLAAIYFSFCFPVLGVKESGQLNIEIFLHSVSREEEVAENGMQSIHLFIVTFYSHFICLISTLYLAPSKWQYYIG